VGGLSWREKALVTEERFQRMRRLVEEEFPLSKKEKWPPSMTEEDLFMIRTMQSWNFYIRD